MHMLLSLDKPCPEECIKSKQTNKQIHIFRNEHWGVWSFFQMMLEILSCLAFFSVLSELQSWSCDVDPAPVYGTADG